MTRYTSKDLIRDAVATNDIEVRYGSGGTPCAIYRVRDGMAVVAVWEDGTVTRVHTAPTIAGRLLAFDASKLLKLKLAPAEPAAGQADKESKT